MLDNVKIRRVAKIDARGWYNRNQRARVNEQVIKNHYSMSRHRGYLGTVSHAPIGGAWRVYRAAFMEEIGNRIHASQEPTP